MNVHVPRKYLADTLGHVERIIPTRSSNSALSLLRIELDETGLIFRGSNLDIDIEARLSADVTGSGRAAVPAQVFGQVIRALPGELVELNFSDSEVEIISQSYGTKLQLANADSAHLASFPSEFQGILNGAQLAKALSHVRYAAAVAEYQAIFRGVKLELSDKRSRAVATDGFRLAYYNFPVASGLEHDLVLPARSVDELIKILTDADAELSVSEGQLSIANAAFRINIKLMEGNFPDYERVIPAQFPISITLDSHKLAEAVSRVAVMADKTANNRVDLFIREGSLQIMAEGSYGRSQEALEVMQEGTEPEMALAYNAKYLVDALGPVDGDLRLSFSGTSSPSVLSSLKDPNYLAMVVPLRPS